MLMEMDSLVAYLPLRVVETHRKKTILGNDYVSISACVCTRITIDLDFGAGRGGLLVKSSCESASAAWANLKPNSARFYAVKYRETAT
ncbi:Uncharacterised protein [Vibrio cholerae]|uniref:Uncharacterized protein n=1 Tax=Vibrio cholerae TaxID=666 RepID=A0A655WDQ5_VIBCL|nr:Uncharacterised protein [Vibrio cholerae]CSB10376.1 Uncharacterised protein [Vibrio cholerae]CSB88662.1 Uncharacterised protein [Vibrio cholerae]CSC51270.1 Uncharacterised protein [Vibrio cholerae]CSC84515.1 Uncharacterised protein [Vibrio cholerae]